MSKAKQSLSSATLRRLQRAFYAGDYVSVRQLAQELKHSDVNHSASAHSWVERTQNDSVCYWLALPVALLVVVAAFLAAG